MCFPYSIAVGLHQVHLNHVHLRSCPLSKQSSASESFPSVQTVVLIAGGWAIFALLFFLLFSVPLPGQERPQWYGYATYVLSDAALLGASALCFRNWRSAQIVSGRTVWLAIGLGMLSYFVGDMLLAYWELGLGKSPDVSPGDFFFLATYLLWGWGMLMAVTSRQLSLSPPQWLIIIGIFVVSVALAYFLVLRPSAQAAATAPDLPTEAHQAIWVVNTTPPAPAPELQTPATAPLVAPEVAPAAPEAAPAAAPEGVEAAPEKPAPAWATAIENLLLPFSDLFLKLYLVGDVILVVMASTLLMAFWGGRFSLSWRFIAAAGFSFYIADLWFLYAIYNIPDYETGSLPEVFWIFSPCLYAIGAALEYDLSTRSRRSSRRRA